MRSFHLVIVFRALVKRFSVTGAVVCCLGLVVVAAPALSFSEYRPEPVDFSMAASADALQGVPVGAATAWCPSPCAPRSASTWWG